MEALNYAIVGEGATGMTAAFYARRTDPGATITVYSEEPNPPYYRPALTNYLMGELRAQQLFAAPPTYYQDLNVVRVLTRVNGIDAKNRRLYLSGGETPEFDRVVVAAGARPRLPVAQLDMGGVMTVRTIQDVRFIMDLVQSGRMKKAVVVGDGILALELVAGLRSRKVDVTYLLRGTRIMPEVLDQTASDLVVTRCRHFGVDVRPGEGVGELHADPQGWLRGIRLGTSGTAIEADWLGVAIGIQPNIEFLEGSGIQTNKGIPVDEHMRSNLEHVYAGGDIAEITDRWTGGSRVIGLWEPARHHGRVAGINMAGGSAVWRQEVPYLATRLYDLDLGVIGDSLGREGDQQEIEFPKKGTSILYKKLVFRDGRLVGALLLGPRKEGVRKRARLYRRLIDHGVDVTSIRSKLLDPYFDLRAWIRSIGSDHPSDGVAADRAGIPVIGRVVTDFGVRAGGEAAQPTVTQRIPDVAKLAGSEGHTVVGATFNLANLTQSRTGSNGPATSAASGAGRSDSQVTGEKVGEQSAAATLKLPDGSLFSMLDRVVLGSSAEADLRLDDPLVSPFHAEIQRRADGFFIASLGGETAVNEERIEESRKLLHSDLIRIGAQEISFVQQIAPPRAQTGPVGLPAEPIDRLSIPSSRSYGVIEWDGGSYQVTVPVIQIGRDPDEAEVVLSDPAVSWLHAEVTDHNGVLYVRDLGSRNGTFVNGDLVVEGRPLVDGTAIRVGQTDLVFRSPPSGPNEFQSISETIRVQTTERHSELPARLVGQAGSMLGVSFALLESPTTIGRDPSAGIVVADPIVSRTHASVQRKDGKWTVADAGSANGTYLNGSRLPANVEQSLSSGDELTIGHAVLAFHEKDLPAQLPRQQTVVLPIPSAADGSAAAVTALYGREGPATGRSIPLDQLPVVLGREQSADVVGLNDDFVSARHAEIDLSSEGVLTIKDLASTNGTFLDGTRLESHASATLSKGALVRLGPSTTLEVR